MKLKAILLILSLLIFMLTLTGGIFYYQSAKTAAIQQNHLSAAGMVNKAAEDINVHLLKYRAALSLLAASAPPRAALRDQTPATLLEANETLDSFNKAFHNGIFYLLDAQGTTIASSNRKAADSFVGHNYGFRPYFQEALQGRATTFLGLGTTSKQPGIYQSHPVPNLDSDRIIGVAVGKFPLDELLGEINHEYYQGLVALTGPSDIVFLSNRAELTGTLLWETSAAEQAQLAASRQFGPGPWPWSGIRKIDATHALDPHGRQMTIHRQNIDSFDGWHLIFLHDDTLFTAKLTATLAKEIGTIFAVALVVISFLVIALYAMANQEIKRRKRAEDTLLDTQQHLEILADERTTALRTTNQELHAEIAAHKQDTKKLEYSNKTLEILNQVLRLSQKARPLQEFLNEFLLYAGSVADLGLLPKGALFLANADQPGVLQLKAHYNLSEPLPTICKQVEFGRCLCGRAAATGQTIFANQIDERHENTYPGIHPHGHYCVPILSRGNGLLGVYNVYTKPLIDHDPRVEKLLNSVAAVLASVIEYKTAETKIRQSHAKHRAITDTANDSIVMVNHFGLITFWNPAAAKLFGFPIAEALGRKLHELIAPANFQAQTHAGFDHFLETGQGPIVGKTVEMLGLHKSGAKFPIELSVAAVQQGQHWAAVVIIRDITARKENEADKLKMEQQLQHAQKMEAIGTLAGGIAHDFNNILSSILGYAELVRDDMPATCSESLDDLAQVIKAGNRAKELVKQILTFSRETEEEIFPLQISLVVNEALKLLRASLPKDIEVRQMISTNIATVLSEPTQIHQIIMNLCTNSYRAMRKSGGVLDVRLETFTPGIAFADKHPELGASQYLCLTVSDTGHGIAPTVLPRIFDPYFSTHKKEDGTGLGLAIVHGIVTKLGGAIEVDSQLDVGTTFKIFLPVAQSETKPEKALAETEPHGMETILLVDDELSVLRLEERMLTSLGYKTVCRTSSIEALELFRNRPDRFDLVITDHSMPNMTGAKLAETMTTIRPDIPIILCTGYSELNIWQLAEGKYIQQIIMKPLNKKELAQAIRQVLDHDSSSQAPRQKGSPEPTGS